MIKSKLFPVFFLILTIGLFWTKEVQADTLSNAKDTISTSRPSAMSTLSTGATAPAAALTIGTAIDTNLRSRFIASDSALLVGGPGANETVTIASMSAVSGSTAALYLATKTTGNHNIGTTVMTPVTARHIITFTTVNQVPGGGDVLLTFPTGNTITQSYPSTSGFSFNNLASGNLSASFSPTGPTCDSWTISASAGTVRCNLAAGVGITGPTAVTLNIGLTATNPVLINPAKTAVAGTQDAWTVSIKTRGSDDTEIDTAKVRIAVIESVQVYATVDPYINFSIQGLNNNVSVGTSNAGCVGTDTTNSGFNSSATEVDLGVLGAGQINLAAQLLTVTTNGVGGFSLTATAGGHLIDPAIGYWIADTQGTPTDNETPVPGPMVAGTTGFGIHPCGQDAKTSSPDWSDTANETVACGTGAGGATDCLYANPSATYYYTLANDASGPIGSGSADGGNDGLTTVIYAATISNVVPAGNYRTAMTYVATATF